MKTLLGVDVGTTSLKMVLFDTEGNPLKTVSKSYTLETSGDRVEFDPENYWQMFSEGYQEIKAEYPVTALAIDTQCETLIVTDGQGKALYNAIVWLDNRATEQAEKIDKKFGAGRGKDCAFIHPGTSGSTEKQGAVCQPDCGPKRIEKLGRDLY